MASRPGALPILTERFPLPAGLPGPMKKLQLPGTSVPITVIAAINTKRFIILSFRSLPSEAG
jgi:hypothetical protein